MGRFYRKSALIFVLMSVFICASCGSYKAALRDKQYEGPLPKGYYTLIKSGGANYIDFSAFVLIVPEKSPYKFDIYKPDFEYTVVKGVKGEDALRMAHEFVSGHPEFLQSIVRELIMPDGSVAGYEARALYRKTFLGREDLFDINYLVRSDNTIEVRIFIDDAAQNFIRAGNGGDNQ